MDATSTESDLNSAGGQACTLREIGFSFITALVAAAPLVGMGAWYAYDRKAESVAVRQAEAWAAQAHERLIAGEALPELNVDTAAHGRDLFLSACAVCHGADALGRPGLGKNIVESDFVAGRDDAAMVAYLIRGRPDAKPVAMPPRAGRPDLTDEDLGDIVAYVRGLQDPRRMPELPEPKVVTAAVTEAESAQALAAAGGDEELAGWIASGNKLFHSTCVACHGPGGVGVQGNGKPLVNNPFIQGLDDDSLLAFIQRGRDPGDKANTTGIGMPAKGGNPALSEDDLLDIISYLRTLQQGSTSTGTGK